MTEQKETVTKIPRYNVLVVDDEEQVRNLVVFLLSKRGHQCLGAIDGVDAMNKIMAYKIDAMVTDIVMPNMDGITLTKEVVKKGRNIPIMVMTAHDNEFSSVTAITAGAREFIQKPFSVTEFSIRFQKMMSDQEVLLRIDQKKNEMIFNAERKSTEKIRELEREIEALKNRLSSRYFSH